MTVLWFGLTFLTGFVCGFGALLMIAGHLPDPMRPGS